MDIYKRGQGVYARWMALVILLLFVGWGCYEVYRLPSGFAVLVRTGELVTPAVVSDLQEELSDSKNPALRVKGLANQKADNSILNQVASDFVQDPDGEERYILEGEAYTQARLKKITDAGIHFVPVQGRSSVAVDDLLPGMVARSALSVPKLTRVDYVQVGEPLTEELARRLREENAAGGGLVLSAVYPDPASYREKDEGRMLATLPSAQAKAGMVLSRMPPPYSRMENLVLPGSVLTEDVIRTLKKHRGQVRGGVDVEDAGRIRLSVLRENAEGRYLRSAEPKRARTWATDALFTVPVVKLDVTPILLISLALFAAGALAVLSTWNWKKWNDLLIETQLEMKKVSWPKRQELIGSSVIVIVMVLVLGFYLYLVDLLLTFLSRQAGLYPS